jgi:hypothetical protein
VPIASRSAIPAGVTFVSEMSGSRSEGMNRSAETQGCCTRVAPTQGLVARSHPRKCGAALPSYAYEFEVSSALST